MRAAKAAGRGEYGRVTIGFAGASSHETLPHLTRAVRAAHPALELVMRGQTYANVALDRVADGSLDLGFVRLPVSQPGVAYRVIDEEELVCALPFDHRLARLESVPIDVLAEEPFVSFPANTGSTVRDAMVGACEAAGFNPRVVQEAPDSYTILALVAAGVGVTLTVTSVQHIQQNGLVYRPLSGPPIRLQAALAWRADNPPPRCGRCSPWRRKPCPRRRARPGSEPQQAGIETRHVLDQGELDIGPTQSPGARVGGKRPRHRKVTPCPTSSSTSSSVNHCVPPSAVSAECSRSRNRPHSPHASSPRSWPAPASTPPPSTR